MCTLCETPRRCAVLAWKNFVRAMTGNTSQRFTVMLWNARDIVGHGEASRAKWDFLDMEIWMRRPTVLVLVLLEARTSTTDVDRYRRWAQRRSYSPRFIEGEGSSTRKEEDKRSFDNGILVLIDDRQAICIWYERIDERVIGLRVRHKTESEERRIAAIHGLHGKAVSSFSEQLDNAHAWLSGDAGGILVGDFNKVAHPHWRQGCAYIMTDDDLAVGRLCGMLQNDGVACDRNGESTLIPGCKDFTRLKSKDSIAGASRIDFGIAFGVERLRWWQDEMVFIDRRGHAVSTLPWPHELMSDHAVLYFSAALEVVAVTGELRARNRRSPAVGRSLKRHEKPSQTRYALQNLRKSFDPDSFGLGMPNTPSITNMLVDAAIDATSEVVAQHEKQNQGSTTEQYWAWRHKLQEVLKLRRERAAISDSLDSAALHPKAGLRKFLPRLWHLPRADAWQCLLAICRRNLRRLGLRARAISRRAGNMLILACRELVKSSGGQEAAAQALKAWDAIRGKRQSVALDKIGRNDDPTAAGVVNVQLRVQPNGLCEHGREQNYTRPLQS